MRFEDGDKRRQKFFETKPEAETFLTSKETAFKEEGARDAAFTAEEKRAVLKFMDSLEIW